MVLKPLIGEPLDFLLIPMIPTFSAVHVTKSMTIRKMIASI